MERDCAVCGTTFTAKRSTAKYCGSSCRARASQGAVAVSDPHDGPISGSGPIFTATMAELAAIGRASSALGLAAAGLAARLDGSISSAETGAGLAALVREFRAAMEAAKAGAQKASDPLDELRERRDRKRSAG